MKDTKEEAAFLYVERPIAGMLRVRFRSSCQVYKERESVTQRSVGILVCILPHCSTVVEALSVSSSRKSSRKHSSDFS